MQPLLKPQPCGASTSGEGGHGQAGSQFTQKGEGRLKGRTGANGSVEGEDGHVRARPTAAWGGRVIAEPEMVLPGGGPLPWGTSQGML